VLKVYFGDRSPKLAKVSLTLDFKVLIATSRDSSFTGPRFNINFRAKFHETSPEIFTPEIDDT
jgi:hypothetical protein